MTSALLNLLHPIRAEFDASAEWQDISNKAYPPPEVKKKEKKVKDKGSRHPGAGKGAEAQPDGHVEGKWKDQVDLETRVKAEMEKPDTRPEKHS